MSMENAKTFYEKVKVDEGLQQRIGQLAKEDPKGIGAVIIRTAKENGFEFTDAEMKTLFEEEAKKINPSGELGDSELESVAGGSKAHWAICSIFSLGIACAGSAIIKEAGAGCSMDRDIDAFN